MFWISNGVCCGLGYSIYSIRMFFFELIYDRLCFYLKLDWYLLNVNFLYVIKFYNFKRLLYVYFEYWMFFVKYSFM